MWYYTNRINSSLGNKSIKEFAKSNRNHNTTFNPEFEGKSTKYENIKNVLIQLKADYITNLYFVSKSKGIKFKNRSAKIFKL